MAGTKGDVLRMSTDNLQDRPTPNSYWVIPGCFAAGEYPGALEPREAERKLKTLLSAGIDHFIDLTEPGELATYAEIAEEKAHPLGLTISHERHPIVDLSLPLTPGHMSGILDAIDAALDDGKTVYLHCWGGVGRTGTVVGCWLVRHGHTGPGALSQIAEWWKGMSKSKVETHPRSPETVWQRDYVRDWTEPPQLG